MIIFNIFFYSRFKCKRCINNIQIKPPAEDTDCTSHLSQWYHCSNNKGLPDSILAQAWSTSKCVSFVFHHRSQGEAKPQIIENDNEEEKKVPRKRRDSNDEDYSKSDDDSDYEM